MKTPHELAQIALKEQWPVAKEIIKQALKAMEDVAHKQTDWTTEVIENDVVRELVAEYFRGSGFVVFCAYPGRSSDALTIKWTPTKWDLDLGFTTHET